MPAQPRRRAGRYLSFISSIQFKARAQGLEVTELVAPRFVRLIAGEELGEGMRENGIGHDRDEWREERFAKAEGRGVGPLLPPV